MKGYEIIAKLEELSPPSYAAKWDNVGLLVGRKEKEVRKVFIALDATDEVIQNAIELQADLLLTHHPLIFSPLKKMNADHFIGRRVLRLARHDIAYYAMHSNFDVMGMADAAADEIGLKKREVLDITFSDEIANEGFGRVGKLPHIMSLAECAEYVKKCFHIEQVKVYGDMEAMIETAAICPGSGKSMIQDAVDAGADVFITGDIDHHDGIDANSQGLQVIDAGHFGLEKIFIPYMKEFLKREFVDLTIFTYCMKPPFVIY